MKLLNIVEAPLVLLADDITVIINENDPNLFESNINTSLEATIDWFMANNLNINLNETI